MQTIEFQHTNLDEFLKQLSKLFKVKIVDKTIELPKSVGSGFYTALQLTGGIQVIINDSTYLDDFVIKRKKIDKDFFVLRFDELLENSIKEVSKSAVMLSNCRFDGIFMCPKNIRHLGVTFMFNRVWVDEFLGNDADAMNIKKFLMLKTSTFTYEALDIQYKQLISEIFTPPVDKRFAQLTIQNRLLLLLERFFTRVCFKMRDLNYEVKVSELDLERLKAVEEILLKDFSATPPGINQLAKMAAMSPSKLKSTFKEVYGTPIYQYYQKHRMNKAKAMLLSKKYNVREVGMEVGYTNLSNFAKAFKKSFDQLPSDFLN